MAWGDKHIRYQRMEEVLGVDDLASGLITPAVNEGGAATFAAGALLVDSLAGNVITKEIGTLGIQGLSFEAAGAHLRFAWDVPSYVDTQRDLGIKVRWATNSVTDADDIHWVALHGMIADGEALAAPATVLDTAIAAETVGAGAALARHTSPRGVILASKISAGDTAIFDLELDVCDADVGATESVWLTGVVLDFVPRFMKGDARSTLV